MNICANFLRFDLSRNLDDRKIIEQDDEDHYFDDEEPEFQDGKK